MGLTEELAPVCFLGQLVDSNAQVGFRIQEDYTIQ